MIRQWAIVTMAALLTGVGAAEASTLSEVYKRVRSSVVVIQTEQKEVDPVQGVNLVDAAGLGSGVLISKDGQIMTAAHVVQAANKINVTFMSGETIPARVVASEPSADLALIQTERRPSMAQVAPLGDSDRVQVGEQIFVVGAPFGISHSLTVGYISARRQENSMLGAAVRTELFQTDAAINQGNSGGPMFNERGEVVGIVSYILSHSGGFEGLGFVVTSNMARRLLLEEPTVWGGVQSRILEGDLARLFNVPQPVALLVEKVAADSPAQKLGLKGGVVKLGIANQEMIAGGDIILDAFGVSLGEQDALVKIRERMRVLKPGDTWLIRVLRGGEILELKAEVGG